MIVACCLALAVLLARPVSIRRPKPPASSTVADLARLLSIATAAGLPLATALEVVVDELSGDVQLGVRRVVRSARTVGLTAALLEAADLGSIAPALARAHSTGSPLSQTLDAHLTAHGAERVSRALEAARTAPVRVMVPLALLLLPGFTALVVGPTLLDHVIDVTRFGR